MEDTVLSLRIVTTSAALLTLAAGGALAQTATTTATEPGKPLPLLRIFQKSDDAAAVTVTAHRRIRYVHRRTIRTRVASHTAGAIRDEYMQVQPAPGPAQPETTQVTPQAATTVPANIWPTPDLTLPGTEGLMATPMAATPFAGAPVAPMTPANPDEMLAAAYHTVQAGPQVSPPSAEQVSPPIAPQITPPSAEQVSPPTVPEITPPSAEQVTPRVVAQILPPSTEHVTPPSPVQVAEANTVSPTELAPDQPHDVANTAKASNPAPSGQLQQVMVASAEPQNPNPVGSPTWIAHILAALGGAIAAGAVAWVLINPLPVRSYE
jgi:hypothetical protein